MKRMFYFILLFFITFKVYALVDINVTGPFIRFEKQDDYVLQGFTNVDNKLFTVFIDSKEEEPLIKIFDLDNGKLIKDFKTTSVGHANDVTYNSKENLVYVLHGNGKKNLHVFDGTSFERLDDVDTPLPIRSITYIEDKDIYAVRTVTIGFYLDKDFVKTSRFPFVFGMNFNSDIGRQGWTYYDNFIYYANWSWIRLGGDGTNSILVYDLSGNKTDELKTKDNIGELEDVSFYNNKMILGFNTYDDYIEFYKIDIPEINKIVASEEITKQEEVVKDKVFNFKWYYFFVPLVVIIAFVSIFIIRKKM